MRAALASRASSSAACARHAKRRALALPVNRARAASSGGGGGPGTSGAHARGAAEGGFWGDNASLGAGFLAVAIGAVGLSYASVPLYRVFCQATGYGGTVRTHKGGADDDDGYDLPEDPSTLPGNRTLTVTFDTVVDPHLPWSFKPAQKSVQLMAGQTALAFFETTNHSDEPIVGVATYNVVPMQSGPYFNKIQCFCFDEQRLLPGETVDMPVFFYVDPDFLTDRRMKNINTMTLSYTFWKSDFEEEEAAAEVAARVAEAKAAVAWDEKTPYPSLRPT